MIVVNFDILIHKGFTVIQKIAFSELCKAWRHDLMGRLFKNKISNQKF